MRAHVYSLPNGQVTVWIPDTIAPDELPDLIEYFELIIRQLRRKLPAEPTTDHEGAGHAEV
jgi:hypothetical protein